MSALFHQLVNASGTVSLLHQGEAEDHGNEQDLQNLPLGKCAEHRLGNDVQNEILRGVLGGFLAVAFYGCLVAALAAETMAGLHKIRHQQADAESERGDHLEVHNRRHGHAPDLRCVRHVRNPRHDRAEDDGANGHLDQLDKAGAQGLHPRVGRHIWSKSSDEHTQQNG